MAAPLLSLDLEGAMVATIKEYKGKSDIMIVRFRNGCQILLDSGNNGENNLWVQQFKICMSQIYDYNTSKLIKERGASEKWLQRLREQYGFYSGAPLSPEAAIAIRTVEDELAALDEKILAIKDQVKNSNFIQQGFQDSAQQMVNTS